MSPALVIGHPTTLVVSLPAYPRDPVPFGGPAGQPVPAPGLAGGHVLPVPRRAAHHQGQRAEDVHHRTGRTDCGTLLRDRPCTLFTQAAPDVSRTADAAVRIPEGFQGGALDFASSLFAWLIFHAVYNFKYVGSAILVLGTRPWPFSTVAASSKKACNQ